MKINDSDDDMISDVEFNDDNHIESTLLKFIVIVVQL